MAKAKLTKNTLVGLDELTDITGRTKQNINKMAADGVISRHGRGLYKLGEVLRAMLKRRELLPTQERYWRAKADEIEHRNAVTRGEFIPIEDVRAMTAIIDAARYSILQGLPAMLFRNDRDKRRELEKQLDAMWNQANERVKREFELLNTVGEPDDNDEEEKSETETQHKENTDDEASM